MCNCERTPTTAYVVNKCLIAFQESDWQIDGGMVETLDMGEGEVLEGDVEYLEVETLDDFDDDRRDSGY